MPYPYASFTLAFSLKLSFLEILIGLSLINGEDFLDWTNW